MIADAVEHDVGRGKRGNGVTLIWALFTITYRAHKKCHTHSRNYSCDGHLVALFHAKNGRLMGFRVTLLGVMLVVRSWDDKGTRPKPYPCV